MTNKQKENYNKMLDALRTIVKFQTPEKMQKDSNKDWGLDYEECLEMAYDNIQGIAKLACKGVRAVK